jgi:choline kinase
MKAIILSAGQGRRLLPLTERTPKCLLPVADSSVLEHQLRVLARCGVEHVTVVVGFGARHVERFLADNPIPGIEVEALFNPFYIVSDNLATCWVARGAMDGDFLLINGDTIFEDRVLRRLLETPRSPVTLTIDHKREYDEDDMKVTLDGDGKLLAIGKQLKPERVSGESIGLLRFQGEGSERFQGELERAMRDPEALRAWYLSVVDVMAQDGLVDTASIRSFYWREIDSKEDLDDACRSWPGER